MLRSKGIGQGNGNMKNVIVLSLEPIETRYTGQWYTHIPSMLRKKLGSEYNVIQIDGVTNSGVPTNGAFLDFLSTNQWKNEQVNTFFHLVKDGLIQKGDHIIFTDAWNPTIVEIQYVNELMGMNWTTHGLWHAGSYDKFDFLGRLIGNKPWVEHAELSFFNCFKHNYFATDFHINLFLENLLKVDKRTGRIRYMPTGKIVRTGWPMEYLPDTMQPYVGMQKEDIILFPHRIAPEKQLDIFKDLEKHLPQYKFIVCQEEKLAKHEYHTLLGKAKMVFSANLQETLGISLPEGALLGAIPLAPDRLSYSEMYSADFLYPSEWTSSYANYEMHRNEVVERIVKMMSTYERLAPVVQSMCPTLIDKFFSADGLINTIKQA